MKRNIWIFAVIAIFLLVTLWVNVQGRIDSDLSKTTDKNSVSDRQLLELGKVQLKTILGEPILFSNTQTHLTLINFWATWCPPCQAEIPHLIDLHERYALKGLKIVGISMDDSVALVIPFARSKGMSYEVAMGTDLFLGLFGGVRSIPTTYLINDRYEIVEVITGYNSLSTLERKILKYL
jgi:thiol-disulfide isomerase/thioredoxin